MHRLLIVTAALATLLLLLTPGHRAPDTQPAPLPIAAATHRAPIRVATCRVVDRVTRGLFHRVLRHRARALHERETDEALVDDDLDELREGRHAVCSSDDDAARPSTVRRARVAARPPRTAPALDPSRFAAGRGLPRGPPATAHVLLA